MATRYSRRFVPETTKLTDGSTSAVKEEGRERAAGWGLAVSGKRGKGGELRGLGQAGRKSAHMSWAGGGPMRGEGSRLLRGPKEGREGLSPEGLFLL